MSASSDGGQAIEVVIEKLQEIVDDIQKNGQDKDCFKADPDRNANKDNVWRKLNGATEDDNKPRKGHQSLEFKNSTHINIVPLSDSLTNAKDGAQGKTTDNDDSKSTSVVITTVRDKTPSQVVLNFPVDAGEFNVSNTQGLIDTLQKLNSVLSKNRESGQKSLFSPNSTAKNNSAVQLYKCAICDYWSHNKYYLKQHVDLVHNAARVYKCPFCDYAGKRSHSLKEHLVVHSNYRPYVCSQCNASFRKKSHLTSHVKLHSQLKGSTTPVCPICMDDGFQNLLALHMHLREAHPTDVYSCDVCQYATSMNKGNITMHMLTHGNPKVYTCSDCDFTALHQRIMEEHILEQHISTGNRKSMKEHDTQSSVAEATSQTGSSSIWLKCSDCGFSTTEKDELHDHVIARHLLLQDSSTSGAAEAENQAGTSTSSTAENSKQIYGSVEVKKTPMPLSAHAAALKELNNLEQDEYENEGDVRRIRQIVENKAPYFCWVCSFESSVAFEFITHMIKHIARGVPMDRSSKTVASLVAKYRPPAAEQEVVVTQSLPNNSSNKTPQASPTEAYQYDESNKWYQCTLCGYSTEFQRSIKAHIWKHTGHKDLDYPMFQNGPLSMYDHSSVLQPSEESVISSRKMNSRRHDESTSVVVRKAAQQQARPAADGASQQHQQTADVTHVTVVSSAEDIVSGSRIDPTNGTIISTAAPEPTTSPKEYVVLRIPRDKISNDRDMDEQIEEIMLQMDVMPDEVVISDDVIGDDGMVMMADYAGQDEDTTMAAATQERIQHVIVQSEAAAVQSQAADHSFSVKQETARTSASSQSNQSISSAGSALSKKNNFDLPRIIEISKFSVGEQAKVKPTVQTMVEQVQHSNLRPAADTPAISTKTDQTAIQNQVLKLQHRVQSTSSGIHYVENINSNCSIAAPAAAVVTASQSHVGGHVPHFVQEVSVGLEEECDDVDVETTEATYAPFSVLRRPVQQQQHGSPVKAPPEMAAEVSIHSSSAPPPSPLTRRRRVAATVAVKRENSSGASQDSAPPPPPLTRRRRVAATVAVKRENSSGASQDSSSTDDDSQMSGGYNDSDAEIVTLLTLLKKGPNFNPACPTALKAHAASALAKHRLEGLADAVRKRVEADPSSGVRMPESGISSSLLAVIEQLRERTNSTSEEAAGDENQPVINTRTRKRKRKRTEEEIEKLINIEEVEKGGYKCLLCHYFHNNLENLRAHMRLHENRKPHQCSLCYFEAKSSEDLQEHMLQHCKTRSYQCKICTANFKYKSQLRAHMCAHNGEATVMVCLKCDFKTADRLAFTEHQKQHSDNKQVYMCKNCELSFTSYADISEHVSKCQQKQPDGASASGEPGSKKSCKRLYHCDLCSYVAHTQAILKSHAKTHDEEQNLQCSSCGFEAHSVRSLKSHMKRHVNDQRFVQQPLEQYKCNLCGYVCHHLPSLKSHMWRHASDKNYNYEQINEIINRALEYDESVSSAQQDAGAAHNSGGCSGGGQGDDKEQPNYLILFRCCQCGYESVNKPLLNMHMKTHSDIIRKTLEVNESRLVHNKH